MNQIETLELKIAKFLRGGVFLAGAIMFVGWIWKTKWNGNPFFNFESYDRIPFTQMLQHHFYRGDWGTLVSYAGLLILISLPLIRVILTAILFVKQKEYALAGIALIVLSGLTASILLGIEL
jgi:uncharacterized membrane protein